MTLLARWEPLREFSAVQDRMNRLNRLFRESYSPEGPEEALTTTSFAPPVDIYEDEHRSRLMWAGRRRSKPRLPARPRKWIGGERNGERIRSLPPLKRSTLIDATDLSFGCCSLR